MKGRTLVVSATNLLARGFLVIPADRKTRGGQPANALFAVARAIVRVLPWKTPNRAVAVVDSSAASLAWPEPLKQQLAPLPDLLRTMGLTVVEAPEEVQLVASYAHAALNDGDDVVIVGVDKRYAQLVSERLWWYDANKDARYTPEIVKKRFNVPPAQVAEWLALVGDLAELPGVSGIGAKGATTLLETYGTVAQAIEKIDSLEGRLGKVVRAALSEIPGELARAKLDTARPLPVPLEQLQYAPKPTSERNAHYDALGFVELLQADKAEEDNVQTNVLAGPAELEAFLTRNQGQVITLCAAPDTALSGFALAGPSETVSLRAQAAPAGEPSSWGGLWGVLARWIEDPNQPKSGHDLVGTSVALRAIGLTLRGVVFDTACASHLSEPSNWAPHDLSTTAKHVLGRALPEDDAVLGVGRARKTWETLPEERSAAVLGQRAEASAALRERLQTSVEPALMAEYLELSETLVRMELTGLAVDQSELGRAEEAFATIEAALEAEIEKLAGHRFNINSSKQLGTVLFEQLKLPIASHTKTGWSTSQEALDRIEGAHPIVPLVSRWRGLRRLRDSWLIALRKFIASDGRIHSRFHLARSFSGQLINSNPDLGRVPGRTPEMARIRRAFVASPGKLLMSVDFSQLGLFVLAHLTKDPALCEPLRERADLHRLTASAVLELPAESLSYEQRQIGKVVNFATFAGQGASALSLQLGLTPEQAREYIARFYRRYAKVREFQEEQLRLVRERGYVITLAGRRWPIGGLESQDPMLRSYAERLAKRATHEGSVNDVSRRALLEVDRALRRAGLETKPLLQILDEVLFEVPEQELEQAARLCATTMRDAFVLEVPLRVGVEVGPNWADISPYPLN
jgi:DNA polymerase-1